MSFATLTISFKFKISLDFYFKTHSIVIYSYIYFLQIEVIVIGLLKLDFICYKAYKKSTLYIVDMTCIEVNIVIRREHA